jgi:putative membrane protein
MWGCNYSPYYSWIGRIFPGGLFSALIFGLIILILVLLAIKLYRSLRPSRPGQFRDQHDSLAILKDRYARGELSDEEFVKMKNILLES